MSKLVSRIDLDLRHSCRVLRGIDKRRYAAQENLLLTVVTLKRETLGVLSSCCTARGCRADS